MGIDYSTDSWGEVKGGYRIIGAGRARAIARVIAGQMIADARGLEGPVVWVTSNSFVPPLRAFIDADRVWQADNGVHSADEYASAAIWQELVTELHERLSEANVFLGSPDYDNSLFVVDLNRWEYDEEAEETAEDINNTWKKVSA